MTYSLAEDKLESVPLPPEVLAGMPVRRRDTLREADELAKLAGVAGITASASGLKAKLAGVFSGHTSLSSPKGSSRTRVFAAAGAVIAAIGGYAGYAQGYEDEADYENAAFQAALADQVLWKSIAERL